MQVNQTSDAITHAVIGSAEAVEMGMSDDSAHLMRLLSTSLYTYPRLAMVREITCNGWDGHIMAGKTDLPLEVTLTDSKLIIRDFGPGIPHEKIGPIYGTYGNSTKRNDSSQTGGFGLGSKAPFAYTDNFEVISCHGGVKTIYRISASSMQKDGKPAINKIVAVPTEETGITVTIDIERGHEAEILDLVREVAALGEIKVNLNGHFVDPLPISVSTTGYLICSIDGTNTARINVRYGNVVYPIPRKAEYQTEWDVVNRSICDLWGNAIVIFNVPADSVSIQPSREALILTEGTVNTIRTALGKFKSQDINLATQAVVEIKRQDFNKQLSKTTTVQFLRDIHTSVYLCESSPTVRPDSHWSGVYADKVRRAALFHLMRNTNWEHDANDEKRRKIKHLIKNGSLNSSQIKMAKELVRASLNDDNNTNYYKRKSRPAMVSAVYRHRVVPLLKLVEDNSHVLKLDRMHHAALKYDDWGETVIRGLKSISLAKPYDAYRYIEKHVIIARNKTAALQAIQYRRQERSGAPWFVYLAPVHEKHHNDIIQVFKDDGWNVVLADMEPREKVVKVKEVDPNAPAKVTAKKRTGYYTVNDAYKVGHYTMATARENANATLVRKPVAWAYLNASGKESNLLPSFSSEETAAIHKLFGDQVAVITSVTQANALEKKGVPQLQSYIYAYADEKLAESPDFPRYLAFIKPMRETNSRRGSPEQLVTAVMGHPTLMNQLGLRFSISPETLMLVSFYREQGNGVSHKNGELVPAMPLCKALADKVKRNPLSRTLPQKVNDSPWAKYINLATVSLHLECFRPDSSDTQIPYEIVRKLLD